MLTWKSPSGIPAISTNSWALLAHISSLISEEALYFGSTVERMNSAVPRSVSSDDVRDRICKVVQVFGASLVAGHLNQLSHLRDIVPRVEFLDLHRRGTGIAGKRNFRVPDAAIGTEYTSIGCAKENPGHRVRPQIFLGHAVQS